jgi:hypothetical protein
MRKFPFGVQPLESRDMARHCLKAVFGALAIFIFASPVSCLAGPTLISLEELQEQFQHLRDNQVRKLTV